MGLEKKGKNAKILTYKTKNLQGNLFSLQKHWHSTSKEPLTNRIVMVCKT